MFDLNFPTNDAPDKKPLYYPSSFLFHLELPPPPPLYNTPYTDLKSAYTYHKILWYYVVKDSLKKVTLTQNLPYTRW